MGWIPADIPDLTGRRAIVTGANAGLGLEVAHGLAAHGAEVVLACRNTAKAEAAAAAIRERTPAATVEVGALDLADLDSVAAFAASASSGRLDLLVNNAGLMAIDEARTAQGAEMQFGVNHLGHFALTARLLPLLLATPGSRVATMSSMGHRAARGPADPRLERRYDRWQAYFHSKLANLLFTAELQRRLAAAGASTIAVAAHPGASNTDLGTEGSGLSNRGLRLLPFIGQSAERGRPPDAARAHRPAVRGGEYYGPRFLAFGATPVRETPTRAARDAAAARRLWDLSVELSGWTRVRRLIRRVVEIHGSARADGGGLRAHRRPAHHAHRARRAVAVRSPTPNPPRARRTAARPRRCGTRRTRTRCASRPTAAARRSPRTRRRTRSPSPRSSATGVMPPLAMSGIVKMPAATTAGIASRNE